MTRLAQETRLIQNPGLGAVLLWEFCVGYSERSPDAQPPVIPLAFLVLPMVLHAETSGVIDSTFESSGLRTFAEKFSRPSENKRDVLLALDDRCDRWRLVSLDALRLGVACRLLFIDSRRGTLLSATREKIPRTPKRIKQLARGANKLGKWMAPLSLLEIRATLKVRL